MIWIRNVSNEGEVVEKKRARATYEDFLHRKVDPALLEQGAGNEFTARVFPIQPSETKEIVISYSQELEAAGDEVVPLAGLGKVGRLDVQLAGANGGGKQEIVQADF